MCGLKFINIKIVCAVAIYQRHKGKIEHKRFLAADTSRAICKSNRGILCNNAYQLPAIATAEILLSRFVY